MTDKRLQHYLTLLVKWNESINLVGDASAESLKEHVDDSMQAMKVLSGRKRILDLGSGAGFPGIPLKIAMPNSEIVMIDSRRKRVSFLNTVIRDLKLENAKALWGRAEDEAVIKEAGRFDGVVSRATWRLAEYLKMALPYHEKGGLIVAMKSNIPKEEALEADNFIHSEGITLWKTVNYEIGGAQRSLFIYKSE